MLWWILLSEGCPEYCKYDDPYELSDRLCDYEGCDSDVLDQLRFMDVGFVMIVRGRRVIKVRDHTLPNPLPGEPSGE